MDNLENEQQKLSSLLEETDSGISTEEQNSILSQINQMFDGGSAIKEIHELSYRPQKSGSLFPLIAGASVLFLTIAAVLLLFFINYKQEQSILNRGGSLASAESTILREYRQESEQELERSEEELLDMRTNLTSLKQERDELAARTRSIIERQSLEFDQRLEQLLSEERLRLEALQVSRPDIEARIAEYREELTDRHEQELAEVRTEAERRLEVQEQKIEQLSNSYEKRIEESEGDRETALKDLNSMQERYQETELLSRQISSAFLSAITALKDDDLEASRRSLGVVEDFLSRESFRSVPAMVQRLPADREIVSALRQFISFKENSRREPVPPVTEVDPEELREELQTKDGRIAELSEAVDQLTARLQDMRNELSQTQNRLSSNRRELEGFRRQARHFEALAEKLSYSSETPQENLEDQKILTALSDKLEMLEMLNSEPIRRRYPDMEKLFLNYLDSFEEEYQRRGYLEALQDTQLLIKSVNGTGAPSEEYYFRKDGIVLLNTALQLVEELELLVSP